MGKRNRANALTPDVLEPPATALPFYFLYAKILEAVAAGIRSGKIVVLK